MTQDRLQTVNAALFRPHLNSLFEVSNDNASFTAELVEVSEFENLRGVERTRQFSLLLRAGEATDPVQSTYRLKHPELGELDLFLVPIGPCPGTGGMQFEVYLPNSLRSTTQLRSQTLSSIRRKRPRRCAPLEHWFCNEVGVGR